MWQISFFPNLDGFLLTWTGKVLTLLNHSCSFLPLLIHSFVFFASELLLRIRWSFLKMCFLNNVNILNVKKQFLLLSKCFQHRPWRDLSDTTSDPDIMDSVGFHCGISQSLLSKSLPFIQPVTSQNLLTEAHMERYSMTFKNSVVNQRTAPMWYLNILCFHLFLSESSAASFQTDWTGRADLPVHPAIVGTLDYFFLRGLLDVWRGAGMCGTMDYRSIRLMSLESRNWAFVRSPLTW